MGEVIVILILGKKEGARTLFWLASSSERISGMVFQHTP
jgi:hypothetical protein